MREKHQTCQNVSFTNYKASSQSHQTVWMDTVLTTSLLFNSELIVEWNVFCSVSQLSRGDRTNISLGVQSSQVKEQSDDQGLIYTLMLCEGHPLICVQSTASHIVPQMPDG